MDRAVLMGVLNVTPDSFSDGGAYGTVEAAIARGLDMAEQGAEIIDVGGESTRPGAVAVSAGVQIERVIPVVRELRQRTDAAISIDTTLVEVARAALDAGADIINDVSAGTDARNGGNEAEAWFAPKAAGMTAAASREASSAGRDSALVAPQPPVGRRPVALPEPVSLPAPVAPPERMFRLAAERRCGLVLMHRVCEPSKDRYSDQYEHEPAYEDVVEVVRTYLLDRAEAAMAAGVTREAIAIDPGLGFGKSVGQNFELLRRADELCATGYPLLMGASRKSFLGKAGGIVEPAKRDGVSIAAAVALWFKGVRMFRVHDVAWHRAGLAVAELISGAR